MLIFALVPMLALHISLPQVSVAGQSRIQPLHVEWEDDDVRVARVVLAPGQRFTAESPAGSVIVYLTANLDGRMPPAEAAWQAPGSIDMENRGTARFEALVIQFKRTIPESGASPAAAPYSTARSMPVMTAWGHYPYPYWISDDYRERVTSQTLFQTAGVTATKVRQPGSMYLDSLRVDSNSRVIVYLRGGYAWPNDPAGYGDYATTRVQRGDVRVIPANVPHTLTNAGSDPAEFIVIGRQ